MPPHTFKPGALASAAFLMFLAASTPCRAYEKEIAEEASAMAARLNQTHAQTRVAVVDFTDLQGRVTELGRFLAEELSSALARAEKEFSVIDRGHLRELIQEHKLGTTGIIDPKTASKLGKVAGVRNLVGGTITQFQDSIRLSLKVFDSETADIAYSGALNIPKTEVLASLINRDLPASGVDGTGRKADGLQAAKIVEGAGLEWALQGCTLRGPSVTCDLTATSLDQDRTIWIQGATRYVNDLGDVYLGPAVKIGNTKVDIFTFAARIRTKISLTFAGASSQARMISLLELSLGTGGVVQFRDIPFSAP